MSNKSIKGRPKITANSCRICLKTKYTINELRDLRKLKFEEYSAVDVLNTIFRLKIKASELESYDPIPRKICRQCVATLTQMVDFCSMAWDSQLCIKEYKKNNCNKVQCEVSDDSDYDQTVRDQAAKVEANLAGYSCPECGKFFAQKSNLKRHMATHQPFKGFYCGICDREFKVQGNARNHITKQHPKAILADTLLKKEPEEDVKPPTLAISDDEGIETSSLDLKPKKNEIDDFASNMDEDPIKKEIPRNRKNLFCDICQKTFTQPASLEYHLKIHLNIRDFPCSVCDKAFRNKNELARHFRRHTGERPYKCMECGRTFGHLNVMKNHMETHNNELTYICGTCGHRFRTKNSLNSHTYYTHGKGMNIKRCRVEPEMDSD